MSDGLVLKEIIQAHLFRARAEGGYEDAHELEMVDLITTSGRVWLARRIAGGDSVASPMRYMAVGTATAAPSAGNTTLPGEVDRNVLAVATNNNSNVFTAVATFGGASDGLTGVSLAEAGIFNHASSGQGTLFQRVNISATTLQASDILQITLTTNVGSS